jgi:hypothetical protein
MPDTGLKTTTTHFSAVGDCLNVGVSVRVLIIISDLPDGAAGVNKGADWWFKTTKAGAGCSRLGSRFGVKYKSIISDIASDVNGGGWQFADVKLQLFRQVNVSNSPIMRLRASSAKAVAQ